MNADRLNVIKSMAHRLSALKDEIWTAKGKEEIYYETMPERFQSGDRGQRSRDAIEYMDEAILQIEDAIENLERIK